jgi:uncharacterized membrane protein
MNVLDWIVTAIRWFHLLAAVAWVGGGMFWLMVLRPALGRAGADGGATRRSIGEEFRSLVNTAIGVLLITGIVLSATRLTDTAVTTFYVAVLVVKIVLALYMFYVVRFLRPRVYHDDEGIEGARLRRIKHRLTGTGALLIYGVIILGLSDILNAIFENSARS